MPKKYPEPFWRVERNCYFVQLGKKQVRLAPHRDEAYRLYHELMAKPPEQRVAPHLPFASSGMRVVEVLDAFLEWTRCNKAARTFEWYRDYLQVFVDSISKELTVSDLKPYHITRVMDAHTERWSNNGKHNFARSVQRAFNWALKQGLVDRNPIAHVEKPAMEARETLVTPEEYTVIMSDIDEPNFRDLVELAWETGARVQELRKIEARYADLDHRRIVFPPKQVKGKKHYRIVYLGSDRAVEIVRRLSEKHPRGPILRTSRKTPWTKDSINCAFCRLQTRTGRRLMKEKGVERAKIPRFNPAGIEAGKLEQARAAHREKLKKRHKLEIQRANELAPKYHLGAFRKGYTTEALKAGLDTVTVAHLLGHRDATMVSRIYGRVQQDPEYMANAARRAKRDADA